MKTNAKSIFRGGHVDKHIGFHWFRPLNFAKRIVFTALNKLCQDLGRFFFISGKSPAGGATP